jgi:hypothetical protein
MAFFKLVRWGEIDSAYYTGLLYQPWMTDEYEAVGGMRIHIRHSTLLLKDCLKSILKYLKLTEIRIG